MAIYRGVGGAGDISSGITLNEVTELTLRAEEAAVEAEASATAAEAAEAGVAADATAAASSATNSASSATNSQASATAAATSESNAATSATNAATSASTASTAATTATDAIVTTGANATAAATSATNAATSATTATTKASEASTSASNAATSATASGTSATNSANSATSSATSATNSANSATASASSATAAAASYDAFDDRYLGSKDEPPTVDNDGNTLLTGALYWNSATSNLWVRNSEPAWEQATLTAGDFLSSSDIGVSVQAYDATIVVDADIGVTVQGYDATIVVDADIGSTVQAYDADTTKNDVANTFTAAQTFGASVVEKKVAMGAHDIDLSAGNYFTYTLSGAQTLTVSNVASSGSVSAFVLEVTNGGSAGLSYFSGVTWAAATAPTLTAAGVDTLAFFTHDGGTTWRGFVLGLGMGA